MAVVIEFYVPKHFRRKDTLGRERGKLITFGLPGYSLTDERSAEVDFSIQRFDRSNIDVGDGKVVAPRNWATFTTRILAYTQTALSNSAFTF